MTGGDRLAKCMGARVLACEKATNMVKAKRDLKGNYESLQSMSIRLDEQKVVRG